MQRIRLVPCLLAWATSLSLGVFTAVGQVPDSVHSRPAVVIGKVIDTTNVPLSGVEIMVLEGDRPIVQSVTSDSLGRFKLRRVPVGGPYTFIARKMGYQPSRGGGIRVSGDTLQLRFVLHPVVVVLQDIRVKGRRDRYGLSEDDIASKSKKGYHDLLDLIAWQRPFMLGDPYMCSPLDSLGNPIPDEPRIRITRNLVFGPGQGGRKSRPADAVRFYNGIDDDISGPRLSFVRHIYINGMQVDIPNDPFHTPWRILRAIPMQHVAQMRYIDCWDRSVPIWMQYSLIVTLKPLPPAQADSLFHFILAQARPAGIIGDRVLSVKHPTRQVWDSLVRLLTGRDSAANDSSVESR